MMMMIIIIIIKEGEECDGGKCKHTAKVQSPLEGIITARKYLLGCDVNRNLMAALGNF